METMLTLEKRDSSTTNTFINSRHEGTQGTQIESFIDTSEINTFVDLGDDLELQFSPNDLDVGDIYLNQKNYDK